jgi:hypothetical protein
VPTDDFLLRQIIQVMEKNPTEVEKVFKEAHLLIKRLIVEQAGEQAPNTHWTLTQQVGNTLVHMTCLTPECPSLLRRQNLDNIPSIYLQQLYQHLKLLVISYDNMSSEQKCALTTAAEIIKNRDWLVSLAVRCVEHGLGPSATPRRGSGSATAVPAPRGTSRRSSDPGPATSRRKSDVGMASSSQAGGGARKGSVSGTGLARGGGKAKGGPDFRRRSDGGVGLASSSRQRAQPPKAEAEAPMVTPRLNNSISSHDLHGRMRFDSFVSPNTKAVPVPASSTVDKRKPIGRATAGPTRPFVVPDGTRQPIKEPPRPATMKGFSKIPCLNLSGVGGTASPSRSMSMESQSSRRSSGLSDGGREK